MPITSNNNSKVWVVIPAAGIGSRMAADRPKQYLPMLGKTVIEYTLSRFCDHAKVNGIVVTLSPADSYWEELNIVCNKPLLVADGGRERCHSVFNAIEVLVGDASPKDWVLVHDAARPCLRSDDVDRMLSELSGHEVGGILAVPVRDTMKRSNLQQEITETVDRDSLWHALTPQMFRLGTLHEALRKAIADDFLVTDEASAIEHIGLLPRLIEGHADNIKITRPEDLLLAEYFIRQQKKEAS